MKIYIVKFTDLSLFLVLLFYITACKTSENSSQQPLTTDSLVQQVPLNKPIEGFAPQEDTPEWLSPENPYRPTYEAAFELLHTRLDLQFDWAQQEVLGNAVLTMRPYFYAQDKIKLDAKAMDIYHILLLKKGQNDSLRYAYDGITLEILLDKSYTKEDVIQISIDYSSKPKRAMNELQSKQMGEEGIFFINPKGYYSQRPRQIWTQGQTEDNSIWFPTFDKPNIKTSLDIYLTVADSLTTISNGRLISSEKMSGGMRRDYWKQEKPHAPYLTALVVGKFAKVEAQWNEIPLSYYVEPAYEEVAAAVFAETPAMMTYFSELLDYPFPWDKYAQVVVRDFVAGAMENTSLSIFNESLQIADKKALSDYNYEGIIAHELAHQWFGNIVTCESWANLPLNEGFAKYFEYLWQAHKRGEREAEIERSDARNSYFYESRFKREPAIRYHYAHRDDMFDSHSYAKSALILHLLRHEVGDEAFFASLRYYLKQNAYSTVEIHDLRLAFEHITGRDLKLFFDEWFLRPGHPELQVSYAFVNNNEIEVRICQRQDKRYTPNYTIKTALHYQIGDKIHIKPIEFKGDSLVLYLEAQVSPEWLVLDPQRILPAFIDETHSMSAYLAMSRLDDYYLLQQEAISQLSAYVGNERVREQLVSLLEHEFWAIRENALRSLGEYQGQDLDKYLNKISALAFSDPNSTVRASAVDVVASLRYDAVFLDKAIQDSSYYVKSNTIFAYLNHEGEEALPHIEALEGESERHIVYSVADFYSSLGIPNKLTWFKQTLDKKSGRELSFLLSLLTQYVLNQPLEVKQEGIAYLADLALHHNYFQVRKDAYQALVVILMNQDEIEYDLTQIRQKETDRRVLEFHRALD